MPRRPRQAADAGGGHRVDAADGARFPIRRIRQFADALDALGTPKKQRVVAELRQFELDWLGNEPLDALRSRYGYKPVAANDACKRAKVRQIQPTSDTRVLLTIVESARTVYLLDAFHKNASAQREAIVRACERARRLHEKANEPSGEC